MVLEVLCKDARNIDDELYTDIVLVTFCDEFMATMEWQLALVCRSILFQGDNKIVFSSMPLNDHHLDTVKGLAGWKRVLNIYPTNPADEYDICRDLMEDPELNSVLRRVMRNSPGINIIPRGFLGPSFWRLRDYLRDMNFSFKTPETMDEGDTFLPEYYDRKSGFRASFVKILGKTTLRLPEGFIVCSKKEVIDACFFFRKKNQSCVVKQDLGCTGKGIAFIHHQKFSPDREKFNQQMMEVLDDEECKVWGSWSSWDERCVVEEMIDIDENNLQGVISVEFQVLDRKVYPFPGCTMLMDDKDGKTFQGILMSPEISNNPLVLETLRAGTIFSEMVASEGYRGFIDLDCVISKEGAVYALESNVRRTGGTHIYQYVECLLGKDYTSTYWVSNEHHHFGEETKMLKYETYFSLLKNLYLHREGSEQKWRGVMLTNPSKLLIRVVEVLLVATSAEEHSYLRKEVKLTFHSAHNPVADC